MPAQLSIIIPALNAAADLPLCLEGLMPGLEAWLIREVIVVDGGSADATARIAGIQAAKKCSDLIPLCHPLPLTKITVDLELRANLMVITALCKTTGKTGVEMEALTAASIAALTVYDMCKGIDKGMVIRQTRLLEKFGGKSGDWLVGDAEID